MYIKKININNIRSIQRLEMTFDQMPGWHIIIGDNGSGKSSLIKAIALNLVGPDDIQGLREDWRDWLRKEAQDGIISLLIEGDRNIDRKSGRGKPPDNIQVLAKLILKRDGNRVELKDNRNTPQGNYCQPENYNWGDNVGWFSAAYGPFRRLSGGNKDWEKLYYSHPKLAAHLSAFGEDVALTEAIAWLRELKYKALENKPEGKLLEHIKSFVNQSNLLPHDTQISKIGSDGVFFSDGNNSEVSVSELSDGYRSILSMIFELIRQLVNTYGTDDVFKDIENHVISLPGVVLIDEIDAHLHPSWQKEVGFWFRRYFPKLQFIISTHSPLVCRAVETGGSIWRLPAPGSQKEFNKVEDAEHNQLIYGNVLDAYSTDMFGEDMLRSQSSKDKITQLAKLNLKKAKKKISKQEEKELQQLRIMFPSESNKINTL